PSFFFLRPLPPPTPPPFPYTTLSDLNPIPPISFWTVYTHHFQNFRVLPCVCIVRKVICFFRHTITPCHLSFGVHVLICFASACNQSICDSMTRTCVYTSHTCY